MTVLFYTFQVIVTKFCLLFSLTWRLITTVETCSIFFIVFFVVYIGVLAITEEN